jgi:two-component system, chemotaxis family, protein-glutamate methylesterase/glutaminase
VSPSCDLIVIGASWGGLSALECVLGALPDDFATPIAIAQHRAVDSGSGMLSSALGRRSGRDVREAGDKDAIEHGRVYVAPADYHLLVEPDGFALSTEGHVHYARPSIDVLFDSAADVYAERLAAVVLTGANDDGAYGAMRVRRRGGVTIAQDPATAERPEMPRAAIETGAVEQVLPLEEIGPALVELTHGDRTAA